MKVKRIKEKRKKKKEKRKKEKEEKERKKKKKKKGKKNHFFLKSDDRSPFFFKQSNKFLFVILWQLGVFF